MTDGTLPRSPSSEGVSAPNGAGGSPDGPEASRDGAGGSPNGQVPATRRTRIASLFRRLIKAIREGDDDQVENAVLSLSQRSRLLAPLALIVGAFAVLFQGIRLLVTNWKLTLIQVLPAMWIWLAMLNLKGHVFRGRQFNIVRGPLLIPLLLAVIAITAAAFYLNAVFGFAIAQSGKKPEIKPAFADARAHIGTILAWGFVVGLALGISGLVVTRWGLGWFVLSFGIVTGVMMFSYVALPRDCSVSNRECHAATRWPAQRSEERSACWSVRRRTGWADSRSSCWARRSSGFPRSSSSRSRSSCRPAPPARSRR